ncbi:hypothetical protein [Notoacmeibacter marinus]|uniref:hypothetical protein n=1 Tax=Notoacmeibacter marinus TaxID=1876515 RepID=UPI000DF152CE|nr:hypothetical protein [Notoacmeibacter marinus]
MDEPIYQQSNLALTRLLHFIIGLVPLAIGVTVIAGLPWFWGHDLAMVPESVRPYVAITTLGIVLGGCFFIAFVVRQFWFVPVSNLELWHHRAVIEHSTPFQRHFDWIKRGDVVRADVVPRPWMEGLETFHVLLRFADGTSSEVGGDMTVRAEASRLAGLLERELTDPAAYQPT